jgi:predicted acyl esterase
MPTSIDDASPARITASSSTPSEPTPPSSRAWMNSRSCAPMVGYPKARLWVECDGADDMDLLVLVQKLDCNGTPLQQFTVPDHGALMQDLTERGASVLRYKGSDGRLRVSARHLDQTLASDAVPAHTFDRSRS